MEIQWTKAKVQGLYSWERFILNEIKKIFLVWKKNSSKLNHIYVVASQCECDCVTQSNASSKHSEVKKKSPTHTLSADTSSLCAKNKWHCVILQSMLLLVCMWIAWYPYKHSDVSLELNQLSWFNWLHTVGHISSFWFVLQKAEKHHRLAFPMKFNHSELEHWPRKIQDCC